MLFAQVPDFSWYAAWKELGLPSVILLFLGVAAWYGGSWVGTHVLKRVTDRHVTFIDRLETVVVSLVPTLNEMAGNIEMIKLRQEKGQNHES